MLVQKFGGTSVATREGRSAMGSRVRRAREDGYAVVVVVSAMGRAGAPYATDTLLGLLAGMPTQPRERDMLSSCGELVSAVVVAHELRAEGLPAAAYSGADAGILTDGRYGEAAVLAVDPSPLRGALAGGLVPVVAGFQGAAPDGSTATLGRGGSDTTACAIAVALSADAVEIHTDVDGVMTADPRACPEARVLDVVRYEELFQMARHGAQVVHPAAAQAAMEGGVPTRIRNTFSSARGTLVTFAERLSAERLSRVATAVSNAAGIARLRVSLPGGLEDADRTLAQTRVYRAMADAGVSLDMFTPMDGTLAFSVTERDLPLAEETLRRLDAPYEVDRGLAKVTLVGAGMHGVPGVMARVAECLASARVGILQTADSHATISVLVPGAQARDAVRALHDGFGLADAAPVVDG
ncbi:MAG: aspartate kinase [Coriobacteriia bacterium]|nr:aspartate kinase [Coriobacteriia bacterium]